MPGCGSHWLCLLPLLDPQPERDPARILPLLALTATGAARPSCAATRPELGHLMATDPPAGATLIRTELAATPAARHRDSIHDLIRVILGLQRATPR
jgi:hypothetical protein